MFLARIVLVSTLLLAAPASGEETLELLNGDKLTGEVLERTDDHVLLSHPALGPVRIPVAQLAPPESEKVPPGLFGSSFMEGWTRKVNMGLSGSEGNAVNFNLTGGIDMNFENDERRWMWRGRYFFKSEDGSTTDNNARAETRHDWLIPESRWFLFAHPIYDYDQFRSWKHRITASAGPGYEIFESEAMKLRTTLGVSGQHEFQGEKETRMSGVWGLDAEWHIAEVHTLTATNQIFAYVINEPGEFRNFSRFNWEVSLTETPDLSLNLGVQNEYDSAAQAGDKKNDLKYYGTLGLGF